MENCSKEYVAAYLTDIWAKTDTTSSYKTIKEIESAFEYFCEKVNKEREKYGG